MSKSVAPTLDHRFAHDSVSRALELVGERWTMLILREAFFGVRRYGQLAHNLKIPRPTLSNRLAKLVDAGLLERVPYAAGPVRQEYEYRLTGTGRDLFPAIVVLMRWGDSHLAGTAGPPIVLTHETCGKRTQPRLTCDRCGEKIDVHNVTPHAGPAFSAS
jgi:DNA-binding HxlR family transcriptional regulator